MDCRSHLIKNVPVGEENKLISHVILYGITSPFIKRKELYFNLILR